MVVLGVIFRIRGNEFFKESRWFFIGFFFIDCVLCYYVWLWGEGCDLGGCFGFRVFRYRLEK